MPQDPDSLIPDPRKFQIERRRNKRVNDSPEFGSRPHVCPDYPHACPIPTPPLPPRLEGDELVAWVRAGMAIERAIEQHEAIGLAALKIRSLSLGKWQIDPDGHILPRQTEPSSSGTTPPTETAEPKPHLDH